MDGLLMLSSDLTSLRKTGDKQAGLCSSLSSGEAKQLLVQGNSKGLT